MTAREGAGAGAARGPSACRAAALVLLLAALAPPVRGGDCGASAVTGVKRFSSPAPAGARYPRLAPGPDEGAMVLSWLEPAGGESFSLRFSTLREGRWSDPHTIVTGESLFVNWADFPVVTAFADSLLAATWLERVPGETFAYHVRASVGTSDGARWTAPVTVHGDRSATEHGFVSIQPGADAARLVWLDGRRYAGREAGAPEAQMSLRTALLGRDGVVREERELDGRTCDCCNTSVVASGEGSLVAYRDRDAGEIRDLAFVRWRGDSEPARGLLHADGWKVPGCPVNGPALARGPLGGLAAAWYTEAAEHPRVLFAGAREGDDGTVEFGTPVTISERAPLGRVGLAAIGPCEYAVSWLEARGNAADVLVRIARADGTTGPAVRVAAASASRTSGFPQVHTLRSGGRPLTLLAWTEPGKRPRIRLARLDVR